MDTCPHCQAEVPILSDLTCPECGAVLTEKELSVTGKKTDNAIEQNVPPYVAMVPANKTTPSPRVIGQKAPQRAVLAPPYIAIASDDETNNFQTPLRGFITIPLILATTIAPLLSTAPGLGYDIRWLHGVAVAITLGYVLIQGFLYRESKLSVWRAVLCAISIQLYDAPETTFLSITALFVSILMIFTIGMFIRWIIFRKRKDRFAQSMASRWNFAFPCTLAILTDIIVSFNNNVGHVRTNDPLLDFRGDLWLANDMARVETLVVYWTAACIVLSIAGFILRGRSNE